ncbi:signal transduction histidine kinase [Owenweeksia hongkongensis DSM 17368]|uniref:histidine kinase n=1 Tax=Owenweeksia hongkongensis (strain DSM 17368 / CIP 108786 / JCM 12287 / NRRL B-23963 / UST20020801) TaxID=926562 RepID=G8QZ73_OWEHD|nr:tetratricopeptide repeat-containing sensor histidine kinase [Owenweeksia hongkongensis]AEV31456.1 signal transduction histidine kinase [Owenweeksia hongkongensis DSM 17368]
MNIRYFLLLLLATAHLIPCAGQQNFDDTTSTEDTLLELTIKMEDWVYKNIDSSRYYACELMNESLLKNDSFYIAYAYTGLSSTLFYQYRLDEALEYLHVSYDIYQKIGDSSDLSDANMNFGNVYTEMGFFEKGLNYYKSAEDYLPKNSEWLHYNLAYLYYNTSQTFMDLGDFINTQEYLNKAEHNAIQDSAYELLFAIKNVNAELLLIEGQDEEARKYAQLALNQAKEYGDLLEQSKSLELLAQVHANYGNHTKAISFQKEALGKAIEFGEPVEIAKQYGHLSSIMLSSGKNQAALEYAEIAQKYADTIKSQLLHKDIALILGQALESNNFPKEALQAYKTYYAYKDTLAKINIHERILLTQNKIQSQEAELLKAKNSFQQSVIKQDRIVMIGIGTAFILALIILLILLKSLRRKHHSQQIIEGKQKLLNAKSEELNNTNQALRQLNEGKDKLLSILTHDLKQPFNQTLQLLEILDHEMNEDEDLRELTRKVKDTVENTKGTVDNLLTWTKSQFTNLKTRPKAVLIKPLAMELRAEFTNAIEQKRINFQIEMEPGLKVLADPNHLEIILRNLLQNAVKFSNSEGEINVRAIKEKENVHIEVSDDGKGMDQEQIKKLFDVNAHFSTPGTLNEKGTGLGMLIVNDFVQENNGQLEVKSKPNKGSTFRIILPAA